MINRIRIDVCETSYGDSKSSRTYYEKNRNKLSDLYDSERFFLEPVLKKVNSVLDIGCAAGGSYYFCKEANNKIKYFGIDISQKLISIAKNKINPKIFNSYDGYQLNFNENSFDLVFSFGVLHHLHHWEKMIIQMVTCSSKFTIFDLRLTSKATLDDREKYFQIIQSDDKWDRKSAISYLVINYDEFVGFINKNFSNGKYRLESYGYYAKPANLVNIPYDNIFMCSIKIEKNSKSPGIFLDAKI